MTGRVVRGPPGWSGVTWGNAMVQGAGLGCRLGAGFLQRLSREETARAAKQGAGVTGTAESTV